jgi:hypothetical protein
MATKRSVLKSQLPLIVIAATVCLLTLMWFVYRSLGRSRCDSIFEQTADRVHADLEFIKVKGGVTLGAEKVQDLTDSSQKVGIHLKSCCIAQQSKMLNADQFQVCMSGAKDYQTQIIQVATNIKEAAAADSSRSCTSRALRLNFSRWSSFNARAAGPRRQQLRAGCSFTGR